MDTETLVPDNPGLLQGAAERNEVHKQPVALVDLDMEREDEK